MAQSSPSILWFRRDLRLRDNPALCAAAKHREMIPVFIYSPEEEGPSAPGAASRSWLHYSLAALDRELQRLGSALTIRRGPATETLLELARVSGARAVYWNRLYDPQLVARDSELKRVLQSSGLVAESFNASLLVEPWEIKNHSGRPFRVFTPFWKQLFAHYEPGRLLPEPRSLPPSSGQVVRGAVETLKLLPKISWDKGFWEVWTPGEAGAHRALERFLDRALPYYSQGRDRPDRIGTSRLSPHLHFGEVSPRQIWVALEELMVADTRTPPPRNGVECYLREIGWREFSHHLLFHFPHTVSEPLDPKFERFPWRTDNRALSAWQDGRTGFPFVDAGMRELWATGWMHNRVRMVVGSFLVKDLLLHWKEGAAWFWDTLVDADLANNVLGWQWVAGCGADAAPFFRVFNPITQGEKFDPEGAYVRCWVPELARLPTRYIHRPWEAPEQVRREAGVELGKTYPHRIVEHREARERALRTFQALSRD